VLLIFITTRTVLLFQSLVGNYHIVRKKTLFLLRPR